jgi:DNA ligase (NAD+)
MNLSAAKKQYLKAKTAYYNDDPIMSNRAFDILEDDIRQVDPKWEELKKTGVKVANKKTETLLWRFMPSLSKMYDEEVPKYYKSFKQPIRSWIWMDKLDGTSLQLVYTEGAPTQLITRGDGVKGGDISFFIPHLVKLGVIPATIADKSTPIVLRLEGLMKKAIFEKKWSRGAKGDEGFDNSRNMVNGLFNRRDMHKALKDVDLVVLGVFDFGLEEGLKMAKKWKFKIVPYTVTHDKVGHAEWLKQRREKSDYEIDGMVVAHLGFRMVFTDAEKPEGIRAYKLNDVGSAAEVEALEEIWEKTRLNRWSCKIRITPTVMEGATVTYVTAHNPAWMKEKGVGKGAILKVLRSGGVIPKIVGVVKPAKFKGPPGEYELRGRFFYALTEDSATRVQQIHHFMTTLGIELLAEKTIEKLYTAGLKSPEDYISLVNEREVLAITRLVVRGGLGTIMSQKILAELKRVLNSSIPMKKLMVASGCFENGIGERKLTTLEKADISMVDLYTGSNVRLRYKIQDVKGFSDKTTEAVLKGLDAFRKWYEPIKKHLSVDGSLKPQPKMKLGAKLAGVTVVWTGYRDKEQEASVVANGGEVGSSFSSKTTVLLYKASGKASSKVEKAGDRAMTWEQFTKKYKLTRFVNGSM